MTTIMESPFEYAVALAVLNLAGAALAELRHREAIAAGGALITEEKKLHAQFRQGCGAPPTAPAKPSPWTAKMLKTLPTRKNWKPRFANTRLASRSSSRCRLKGAAEGGRCRLSEGEKPPTKSAAARATDGDNLASRPTSRGAADIQRA
jgi:hypothetical protein